jgi:hypothetical protein
VFLGRGVNLQGLRDVPAHDSKRCQSTSLPLCESIELSTSACGGGVVAFVVDESRHVTFVR